MVIRPDNLWAQVARRDWHVQPGMRQETDIGFDRKIPKEDRERLLSFISWVESNFAIPVTLWIDFEYRHYLLNREKQRMGYLLYTTPDALPEALADTEDMPLAKIPVRREKWRFDEILYSIIECITDYYLWLLGRADEDVNAYAGDMDEILGMYQRFIGMDEDYWS